MTDSGNSNAADLHPSWYHCVRLSRLSGQQVGTEWSVSPCSCLMRTHHYAICRDSDEGKAHCPGRILLGDSIEKKTHVMKHHTSHVTPFPLKAWQVGLVRDLISWGVSHQNHRMVWSRIATVTMPKNTTTSSMYFPFFASGWYVQGYYKDFKNSKKYKAARPMPVS